MDFTNSLLLLSVYLENAVWNGWMTSLGNATDPSRKRPKYNLSFVTLRWDLVNMFRE